VCNKLKFFILTILVWLSPLPAWAQFPGASVVTDPQTHILLQQDIQVNAVSARSLSQGNGSGFWQPSAAYLGQLTSNFAAGINTSQRFAADFVGYQPLASNIIPFNKQLVADVLHTYAGVVAENTQLANNWGQEDNKLQQIEYCNRTSSGQPPAGGSQLQASQCITEALLVLTHHIMILEKLQMTSNEINAVHFAEDLNARARISASNARNMNFGVMP
jgi:hypothetical protein